MPRRTTLSVDFPTPRDGCTIAADAAARATEIRIETLASDLRRWREVATAIADGQEPDKELLAELAGLAASLALPDGALTADVAAIAAARKADAALAEGEARSAAWEQAAPARRLELAEARKRVRELEVALAGGQAIALGLSSRMAVAAESRRKHPRLFADPVVVAQAMIGDESRKAWDRTTTDRIPQEAFR